MRAKTRETAQMQWPLAWAWLNPAMGAQAAYNTKLHEAFVTASNEWQMFVAQRLSEDMRVMRELGEAKTPEQMWTISAGFWQKAAENYVHEYAVMTKIAGDFVVCGASAAEEALQAQTETTSHLSKAA
jgi:hypothetical protein